MLYLFDLNSTVEAEGKASVLMYRRMIGLPTASPKILLSPFDKLRTAYINLIRRINILAHEATNLDEAQGSQGVSLLTILKMHYSGLLIN